MREEEKLAQDVYTTLYNNWNVNIFRNIASSEATHTEAVRYLLKRYNLEDPVKIEKIGTFTNQELQELYNDLVEKGKSSLKNAFIVGATVEDLDIKDLNDLIKQTNNQDILTVYDNLIRGSRNHLRAFSKQIENEGSTYTAQFISQEEIDKILSATQERGNNR